LFSEETGLPRKLELLSPAGNLEKLTYAYRYGADAVYVGMDHFSLRQKADNFSAHDLKQAGKIKGDKKLFCAVNALFHQKDIERLERELDTSESLPFDAFIVSDLGAARILLRKFPTVPLHLSTQASCLNAEAVLAYQDLGFSRIILGREVRIDEIAEIREKVPDMELECFVHGAMCLAYSGRCFLSAYLADRSGNEGSCAHACRWKWRVLEEAERPGEYLPIIEDKEGGFTTLLSSKDLCMIDHISDLKDAGVNSLKIEGRMKSLYYTALVTRAYRMAIDALESSDTLDTDLFAGFREELFRVSHREYTTGFYFSRDQIEEPCRESYLREYLFLGTLGEEVQPGRFLFFPKNHLDTKLQIEFIGPQLPFVEDDKYRLFEISGESYEEAMECDRADHGKRYLIEPSVPVEEDFIVRSRIQKNTGLESS
jgi:U32 family peptidase